MKRASHNWIFGKAAPRILLLFTLAGCDDTVFYVPTTEPNVSDFDASLEDDAGLGQSCPAWSSGSFNNAYSPYFGSTESLDVVVEIVSYFRCPYCAAYDADLKALFERRTDFAERVRVYFHHYPITGHDADAWEIHAAAWAAHQQGAEAFWALHDEIFRRHREGKPLSVKKATEFVAGLGLDMERFNEDLASEKALSFIKWDMEQADDLNVRGTPTLFVCGWPMLNRAELEPALDDLLTAR